MKKIWTVGIMVGMAMSAFAAGSAAQDKSIPQAGDPYFGAGQQTLQKMLALKPNTNRAKNVILIVGDGMGVSTVTAARIFEAQQRGADGESNVLAFEAFPYAALTKTYANDGQVSDSAPTATAMNTGVKTNNDMLGVGSATKFEDCKSALANPVMTLAEMAERVGMSTGVVTTTRITHATPAAVYAHVPARDWESDADMPDAAKADGCTDIARQLVEWPAGDGLEVALGGGRDRFLPAETADPEDQGKTGKRKDGKDLTQAWLKRYGNSGAFVWNQQQFAAIDPSSVDHLLGLFERSHMKYEADRGKDTGGEPSLAEMTGKAIDVLSRNREGFFLMVEGGRIDHGHHENNAYKALTDAVALNDAVKMALSKVNLEDTLIVVTADHSHTFTINGYPKRGNPLLGLAVGVDNEVIKGEDGKPYTTLSYANGPGAPKDGVRPDLSAVDTTAADFVQPSAVPLESETHAGEDIGTYAIGPYAHLFQGTIEQNYLYHVMNYASKISERAGLTN